MEFQSSKKKRDKGYKGHQRVWGYDLGKAKNVRETYVANVDTATYFLYKKFLFKCAETGIKVVLVYIPEYI
jgi:hypothetical protein